jgi:peptide/nickel transport system substrate-binding protein
VEVNGQDITIKMRRPFSDMDYYASFPVFTAIPEAKDNAENYGQHPLATGP